MAMGGARRGLLGRHSVRARIALACAGLFLVTGGAFLAATYALVDHRLGSAAANQDHAEQRLLGQVCHAAETGGGQYANRYAARACKEAVAGGIRLVAADQRATDLHELLLWSLVGLGVATVLAGVLGWAAGRRILLPLRRVTAAARRASEGHLDERIALGGPADELKELADNFDDMLNRLDIAFASQRRFVANASHELRTPLTSMRTLIDVAMAKPTRSTEQLEVLVRKVRAVVDQSEALIGGLLTLARSDRGLTTLEPADLEAAAQDAIDDVRESARTANIVIRADLRPSPALGDRVLLERLAANLVDNAVRYNVPGGSVAVATGTHESTSYITVANTGALVPEQAVASLFEPFTRLAERVSNGQGVGLGLSIVASVVNAHNGQLEARALPDGGLEISARLPKPAFASPTYGQEGPGRDGPAPPASEDETTWTPPTSQ